MKEYFASLWFNKWLKNVFSCLFLGLAGDAKLHASSSGIPELSLDSTSHDLSTIDPADLLAVLSPTGTVPGSLGNLPEGFAESSLEDLAGSLNSIKSEFNDLTAGDNFLLPVDNGLGDNDFLENFTDLSAYLGTDVSRSNRKSHFIFYRNKSKTCTYFIQKKKKTMIDND